MWAYTVKTMSKNSTPKGPQFTPGDDSPAWLAALGDADEAAEKHIEQSEQRGSKSLLAGAICPV
jgi:hypothetical protein